MKLDVADRKVVEPVRDRHWTAGAGEGEPGGQTAPRRSAIGTPVNAEAGSGIRRSVGLAGARVDYVRIARIDRNSADGVGEKSV
jgi:hypothetical protein